MKLIDAEELQRVFNETSTSIMREPKMTKDMEHIVRACIMTTEIIKDAPIVDAVPVVRCKDCDWWTKQKGSIQGRCAKLEIYPTGAWFCANGEKRGADNA